MTVTFNPSSGKLEYNVEKPRTYSARDFYYFLIKNKVTNTLPASIPIREKFLTEFLTELPTFINNVKDLGILEAPKSRLARKVETDQIELLAAEKVFIKVFNLNIERKIYTRDQRLYYGLDLDSDNLPHLVSRQEVIEMGHKLVRGEANRVEAGFAAMADPSISEITALVQTFNTDNSDYRIASDRFDDKENEIIVSLPRVDELIGICIDDTLTFFDKFSSSMKRKMSRNWGVPYRSRHSGDPLVFNISLMPNSTKNVTDLEVAPNMKIAFTNTCETELYACLRDTEIESCSLQNVVIPIGKTIEVLGSEVGPINLELMNITNPSVSREGTCTITIS